MTTDGRKCHKDGCDSGARWATDLHLDCPIPGGAKRALVLRCAIEVCDAHRDDVKPWVLSDKNRETIALTLMDNGFHEPDFLTARIEFAPVEGRDIKMVEMCCRAGCTERAKYQIKHRFAEIGRKEMRFESLTNLWVCEKHKRDTKAADLLLNGAVRKKTFEWLQAQGVLLPDLDRSELEFVPAAAMVDKAPG